MVQVNEGNGEEKPPLTLHLVNHHDGGKERFEGLGYSQIVGELLVGAGYKDHKRVWDITAVGLSTEPLNGTPVKVDGKMGTKSSVTVHVQPQGQPCRKFRIESVAVKPAELAKRLMGGVAAIYHSTDPPPPSPSPKDVAVKKGPDPGLNPAAPTSPAPAPAKTTARLMHVPGEPHREYLLMTGGYGVTVKGLLTRVGILTGHWTVHLGDLELTKDHQPTIEVHGAAAGRVITLVVKPLTKSDPRQVRLNVPESFNPGEVVTAFKAVLKGHAFAPPVEHEVVVKKEDAPEPGEKHPLLEALSTGSDRAGEDSGANQPPSQPEPSVPQASPVDPQPALTHTPIQPATPASGPAPIVAAPASPTPAARRMRPVRLSGPVFRSVVATANPPPRGERRRPATPPPSRPASARHHQPVGESPVAPAPVHGPHGIQTTTRTAHPHQPIAAAVNHEGDHVKKSSSPFANATTRTRFRANLELGVAIEHSVIVEAVADALDIEKNRVGPHIKSLKARGVLKPAGDGYIVQGEDKYQPLPGDGVEARSTRANKNPKPATRVDAPGPKRKPGRPKSEKGHKPPVAESPADLTDLEQLVQVLTEGKGLLGELERLRERKAQLEDKLRPLQEREAEIMERVSAIMAIQPEIAALLHRITAKPDTSEE